MTLSATRRSDDRRWGLIAKESRPFGKFEIVEFELHCKEAARVETVLGPIVQRNFKLQSVFVRPHRRITKHALLREALPSRNAIWPAVG